MYNIELSNQQSLWQIPELDVERTVVETLQQQGVAVAEIVIALVDDATIHQVNREHLEHDFPTDVISFIYEAFRDADDSDKAVNVRGYGLHLDGELVISVETAIRMAEEYNWEVIDELRLYLVHGLLHLCGYDDLSDEERVLMRAAEREVLKTWNLIPRFENEEQI